jgi:hypothetical protein
VQTRYVSGSAYGRTVAYAANDTLVAGQNYQKSTNTGAVGAVTLTLPAPSDGLQFEFICTVAQDFIVNVGGSVVIAIGEVPGTPGGGVQSNSPFSSLILSYGGPNLWTGISSGSWTPS